MKRPVSVNYHLTAHCNMRCRFCFAVFDEVKSEVPAGSLPVDQALEVVEALADFGFDKITFAGGEPLIYGPLPRLIKAAKARGMTTCVVTNGWLLNEDWIKAAASALDWITLSIDSGRPETNVFTGRAVSGKALPSARSIELAQCARMAGIRMKVNTVVSAANALEDMSELIAELKPERWKLLKALPIEGQNDGRADDLWIDGATFQAFVDRHRPLEARGITLVPEDNTAMTASYAMVDPRGCFFDNASGRLQYSDPILEIGAPDAWQQISFDHQRFIARGGEYDYKRASIVV